MEQNFSDEQAGISLEYDEIPGNPSLGQSSRTSRSDWTKKEKIIVGSFMGIGLAILILGTAQFYSRKNLTLDDVVGAPIGSVTGRTVEGNSLLIGSTQGSGQENLQIIDTDKDGLTDYEELNTYGTSPYLEDTDSDGVHDKAEIELGENPTCPKGKTCGFAGDTQTATSQGTASTSQINLNLGPLSQQVTSLDTLEQNLIDGSLDPEGLRNLLRENGAPEEALQQVTDEQLQELYTSALSQAQEGGFLNEQGGVNTFGGFENLSVQEIRELMAEGGLDAESLSQLSDEEVIEIYNQALQSLSTQN